MCFKAIQKLCTKVVHLKSFKFFVQPTAHSGHKDIQLQSQLNSAKICPNFMWQIHLLKNWRASFYVEKKKCCMRMFVRVHDPSQKICHILGGWQWLLRFCIYCPWSLLAHRQTCFQHNVCCLYTRANFCPRKLVMEKFVVWTRFCSYQINFARMW